MGEVSLGQAEFWSVVGDFDASVPIGDAQIRLRFGGVEWSVGGGDYESLGVVVPRVIAFARNGAARHWAAFVGLHTAEEVIDTVTNHVFPPGMDSGPRRWDVASALLAYVLSALFDANLGTDCVVGVRGARDETIIVRSKNGAVEAHEVTIKNFDRAIEELAAWYATIDPRPNQNAG